jgi:hypothetical protein
MLDSNLGSPTPTAHNIPNVSSAGAIRKAHRTISFGSFFRKLFGGRPLDVVQRRRWIATTCILRFLGTNFIMFLRFFFPRVLYEPSTVFAIGYPSELGFACTPSLKRITGFGWCMIQVGSS